MTTYKVTGHIGEDGMFTARLPEGVPAGDATAQVDVEDDPVARARARVERLAKEFGEENWLVQIYRELPPTKESLDVWNGARERLFRDREEWDQDRDPRLMLSEDH